jgi:hypothetical protein
MIELSKCIDSNIMTTVTALGGIKILGMNDRHVERVLTELYYRNRNTLGVVEDAARWW